MTSDRLEIQPSAALLIESLRDVGYTLETALADIVDNAIASGARSIEIHADTHGAQPSIAIVDDGAGMERDELVSAMRMGNRSPLEDRAAGDLGRFGLGLKTASFSQCRRLTVLTRAAGRESAAARWDLDVVCSADRWVIDLPEPADVPRQGSLGPTGTLVVWEKLDRLAGSHGGTAQDQHVVRRLDEAADHLELVFHRFLAGEPGLPKITVKLNGRALTPFDPFFARHPATGRGPVETVRLGNHDVTIQAFTLPHHKKVSASEWERYAGRDGYVKSQGFYVYRGRRLIVHGTWFGLARQAELTKLARVRVDIPIELDSDWKIDIKKASAQPPGPVRDRLRTLVASLGAGSKRAYDHRGQKLTTKAVLPVWQRVQHKDEIRYSVNKDHPAVLEFRDGLGDDLQDDFTGILDMLSSAIPIDALFADTSGHPTQVAGEPMPADSLRQAVTATWKGLEHLGLVRTAIVDVLKSNEPFMSNWADVETVLNNLAPVGPAG